MKSGEVEIRVLVCEGEGGGLLLGRSKESGFSWELGYGSVIHGGIRSWGIFPVFLCFFMLGDGV